MNQRSSKCREMAATALRLVACSTPRQSKHFTLLSALGKLTKYIYLSTIFTYLFKVLPLCFSISILCSCILLHSRVIYSTFYSTALTASFTFLDNNFSYLYCSIKTCISKFVEFSFFILLLLKGPRCRIYGQIFNVIHTLIMFSLVYDHMKLRIIMFSLP